MGEERRPGTPEREDGSRLALLREVSRLGYAAGTRSVVDDLQTVGWCAAEDLARAYERVAATPCAAVAIFFQLPFVVRLPARWMAIPAPYAEHGRPVAYFRPVGANGNTLRPGAPFDVGWRESRAARDSLCNAALPNDVYGTLTRTQAVWVYELWEPRSTHYRRYLDRSRSESAFRSVLVDGGASWVEHRALTCESYEDDLVRRVAQQTMLVLRRLLPRYAVACCDPDATMYNWRDVDWLDSAFCMMQNGRVVTTSIGPSMLGHLARAYVHRSFDENLGELERFLARGRRPSQYEQALVAAAGQAESGAPHLAVVQAAMILEWFANLQLDDAGDGLVGGGASAPAPRGEVRPAHARSRRRGPAIERFTKYLPQLGVQLPPEMAAEVQALIWCRNRIVHEEPVAGAVSTDEALGFVKLAMRVIRHCLDQRFEAPGGRHRPQ